MLLSMCDENRCVMRLKRCELESSAECPQSLREGQYCQINKGLSISIAYESDFQVHW